MADLTRELGDLRQQIEDADEALTFFKEHTAALEDVIIEYDMDALQVGYNPDLEYFMDKVREIFEEMCDARTGG